MHNNQKTNRLLSNNGPIIPTRDMNIDFSNAFNAIRNMNLLPPSSSTPQSVSSVTFDDNISLRSSQSAQYSMPKQFTSNNNYFVPDSPLSIASLPIKKTNRRDINNNNFKRQQLVSSYDPYKRTNGRFRQIVSANTTPMKRKKKGRRQRSHSHSRFRSKYHDYVSPEDVNSNFKVVVRVRPPLQRELQSPLGFAYVVRVDNSQKSIAISDGFQDEEQQNQQLVNNWTHNVHKFTFDYVYPDTAQQCQVYETTAKHSVLSALQGYNASIIAYGQTSAGKTYTMEGFDSERLRGIIPRAIEEIFNYIEQKASPTMRFLVRASYLQIYNEVISDLLKSDRTNLQIREDKKKGVYVSGLSEWVVRSCEEIYGLIKRGQSVRATCPTKLNEISSRSHAIFIIIVEQNEITINNNNVNNKNEQINNIKIGKLNLVDLAGSERVRISGAEGARLQESQNINRSLSALGNVISALTDSKRIRKHIPYRDSKLTRILEDSLGGNCKTTMMAMISPALEHYSETVSTLKFANRAKNIKNKAVVNQDLNEKALLRKYEKELKRLKAELAEKSKNVIDKSQLIELQEQKNRAERDKMTAIQYLEKISQDLEREKLEKQQLMKQIEEMNSKLLTNNNVNNTKNVNKGKNNNNQRSNNFYDNNNNNNVMSKDIEQVGEEEKAQVHRYKQLLMKQRDIMIQLTSRLNDRDQSILALQEELDHYDNQQKMMENVLDQKTVKLIQQLNPTKTDNKFDTRSVKSYHSELQSKSQTQYDDALEKMSQYSTITNNNNNNNNNDNNNTNTNEMDTSYINPFHENNDNDNNNNNNNNIQQQLEIEKIEKDKLKQELKEVHADKTSLEYLLRCRINDMVQREVAAKSKQQDSELEKWRIKYENAEERRRNSEYLLELSRVGGKANVLHKQLTLILQKERTKVEEKFHNKIKELKQAFLLEKKLLNQNQTQTNQLTNKSMFDELKKLKNLHSKFSKMQQRVEQKENNQIMNQQNNNNHKNIINMINNENLSELVGDLKQLQNIEQIHNNNNSNNNNNNNSQHLKQAIEHKIRLLVGDLAEKVLNEQNGNAENVKNDIIQAQQIINTSFDVLN